MQSSSTAQTPSSVVLILALALMSVGMGQALVFAILPPIARQLGMNEIEVGAIFSISAVFWIFMSPIWGRWSDRIGRVTVLVFGLAGYALSLFLFASTIHLGQLGILVASLWPLLVFGRMINGILGSATRPAALGYAADISSPVERASTLGRVESGFTIGTILGPALGSLLLLYSLLAPFYFYAALGIVAAVGCVFLLKPQATPPRQMLRRKLSVWDVRLRAQLIVGAVLGICNSTLLQCIGFYLQDVQLVAVEQVAVYGGLFLTLGAVGSVFSQLVLVPRFSVYPRRLVVYGLLILSGAPLLLGLNPAIWLAAGAMLMYGLGFGLVRPGNATLLSLSVRPSEQGAAAGTLGMVIPLGHILTPLVSMPLYRWHPQSPFLLSFGILAVLLVLLLLHPMFRRKPRKIYSIDRSKGEHR